MAKKQRKKPEERKLKGAQIEQRGYDEYAYPRTAGEEDIEACRARVASGEHCFCAERCSCRNCQKKRKDLGEKTCDLEMLKLEGGCAFGCHKCSNCKPCF